ncbi:peptide chain release factor N(5)-glutamine methyltransferase [Gryllotalpicola reticulitermitis]|uniref:Release factor glutamine methyltransferase n=1 Tax=Gryllotalpicola reticulitermitis TaxID=1184153 RepID=A0ABV8Q3Y8_9MICO
MSAPLQTIRELLAETTRTLSEAGVPTPGVDAALLIGFVVDASRGRVQAMALTDASAEASVVDRVRALAARRAAREPLQHITGTAAFRSLELAVGPGVFVPRPETEQVVQFAIDALRAAAVPEPIAVDLGSGSGAIALAMAVEVPHARVIGVEKSPDALPWTRRNFEVSGAANAQLVAGDLGDSRLLAELDGTVDVVISNPPYVPDDAIPRDPEVRLFDPALALYGGPDGLDLVRAVSRTALRLAHPGALLVLEHGELQGEAIRALLTGDGWRAAATHPDLTGRDRATTALRP